MCYPDGDFVVGDRDILLGMLDVGVDKQPDGVPVWIAEPQSEVWKHTPLVIDLVPGRGDGWRWVQSRSAGGYAVLVSGPLIH